MEYKLIETTCPEKLSELVSECLKTGEWKLYGNPVIASEEVSRDRHVMRYAQAVVSTI